MKSTILGILASAALFSASAASAHHPFAAEFDSTKPVTIVGTVATFDWVYPHAFVTVDEKDGQGAVTHWKVELGGPAALTKQGWTTTSMKPGEKVTVKGWLAKDGTKRANADTITLSDGHELSAASSYYQRPKKVTQNTP
jgi:hypothetical protein